jgi:hypothetical protein
MVSEMVSEWGLKVFRYFIETGCVLEVLRKSSLDIGRFLKVLRKS